MSELPVIGFIGIGNVGETLANLVDLKGYEVGAIYNRKSGKSERLASNISTVVAENMQVVVESCDLVILSVSDEAILSLAGTLVECDWLDKALIHVSGSLSIDVLQCVYDKGGMVGSLHPAFPFSDVETAIRKVHGSTFAIEYSHELLRQWLIELVMSFNGHIVEIPRGKKSQYHLALAIASNFTVTLYALAHDLLSEIGSDKVAIKTMLDTLITASVQNIVQQGIPAALTGPLVRSDIKTIDSHLQAIQDSPLLRETYVNLAKLSYPMLAKRDIDITQIDNFLKENWDASDNT